MIVTNTPLQNRVAHFDADAANCVQRRRLLPTTVLVVDDAVVVRRLIRMTLEMMAEGVRILEARDGEAALAMVTQERPEIVLLDVYLPGIDGLEVCRQIKEHPETAATRVALLTVRVGATEMEQGEGVGADAYMTKPFLPHRLIDLIEELTQ